MTTQQTQPAMPVPTPEPEAHVVQAQPGTRLEQLHAAYADAKAAKDEAEKALKAITDAIKVDLTSVDPNERRFELVGAAGAPPLRLTYTESWRVDARKLKAEDPETYVRFARQSHAWRLTTGGGE